MNDKQNITQFLNSPRLLIQLCKDVIARLGEQQQSAEKLDELDEREKQLNEIARTIDKLENTGVSVPGELRQLKTGLVAELAVRDEMDTKLKELEDGLEEALQVLRSEIRRPKIIGRRIHPNGPRTERAVLRKEIIRALEVLGGASSPMQVIAEIDKRLAGKLFPCDMFICSDGKPSWHGNTRDERTKMVKEGILKSNSPLGIWELTKEYK
jgi:hypothetical protein